MLLMILNLAAGRPVLTLTDIIYIVEKIDTDGHNPWLFLSRHLKTSKCVAGRLAAEVLEMIEPYVKPGVSMNWIASATIISLTNKKPYPPASLPRLPKSVCISINEVVCHGIPTTPSC
ncbi:MAG: hypothetical protein ACLTXH_12650 [Enterobacter hormaechei]